MTCEMVACKGHCGHFEFIGAVHELIKGSLERHLKIRTIVPKVLTLTAFLK